MTRRARRRVRRDWWAAAIFVGLIVLLILGAESQLEAVIGEPRDRFASLVLRGLMLIAAGMSLAAALSEPERELQATRRFGFWIAALVPLVWLLFQWFTLVAGGTAGWLVTTPLPPFWFGVAAGTALRQALGR